MFASVQQLGIENGGIRNSSTGKLSCIDHESLAGCFSSAFMGKDREGKRQDETQFEMIHSTRKGKMA